MLSAPSHPHLSSRSHRLAVSLLSTAIVAVLAGPAAASDQMYFPAHDNVTNVLVAKINAETVRIDMSCWYLSEHSISIALINKFKSGVPVRLIGDRGSIFEIDEPTKHEFYWLAAQGLPIRLRVNPDWYPEIDHWKATIFAGQHLVAFGSANYSPFELAPVSSTNYKDETVMLTDDPDLVGAFKAKFDQFWNDTTPEPESKAAAPPYFKDWNDACATEPRGCDFPSQYPDPDPMVINHARLEPDYPAPPDLIWGQGPDFNDRLVQEIDAENSLIQLVIYRLTVDNVTTALLNRHRAGVPIELLIEPNEYLNKKWPEFEITHANLDKLWAAGVPIKERVHQGLTHMKTLVTSAYATNASSNYSAAWQRDHDYFVSAVTKPTAYNAIKTRVTEMWNNSSAFQPFQPRPADPAIQVTPAANATGVSTTPTFKWNRAAFAVSYDVYLGLSQTSMSRVANVPAQLVNNPPTTYSWTVTTPLSGNTNYFWKIVSRTNATAVDPTIATNSTIHLFTTGGGGGGGGLSPFGGTPAPIPGTVQAENFDNGGEGVAYHDSTTVNSGGAYRSTAVDLEAATEGAYDVGWIAGGEWLIYTVDVATAGNYTAAFRVASIVGGSLHVSFNGPSSVSQSVSIPNTGGWQNWTTVSVPLTLGAGTQQLTLAFDTSGFNVNSIAFSSGGGGGGGGGGASDVVIYASDVPASARHGSFATTSDPSSPGGLALFTPDNGVSNTDQPLAAPTHYVDVPVTAEPGTYRIWLRLKAGGNSKYNDSIWVQFNDATVSGVPAYRIGTTAGLLVNLATTSAATSLNGWGWGNSAYWLSQATAVTFSSTGTHTMRIQVREDGFELDQIVLSPDTYFTAAPGPPTNDSTIVPKP